MNNVEFKLNRDSEMTKDHAMMALYHIAGFLKKNHPYTQPIQYQLEQLAMEICDHEKGEPLNWPP